MKNNFLFLIINSVTYGLFPIRYSATYNMSKWTRCIIQYIFIHFLFINSICSAFILSIF